MHVDIQFSHPIDINTNNRLIPKMSRLLYISPSASITFEAQVEKVAWPVQWRCQLSMDQLRNAQMSKSGIITDTLKAKSGMTAQMIINSPPCAIYSSLNRQGWTMYFDRIDQIRWSNGPIERFVYSDRSASADWIHSVVLVSSTTELQYPLRKCLHLDTHSNHHRSIKFAIQLVFMSNMSCLCLMCGGLH